jgi:hypothetical protein
VIECIVSPHERDIDIVAASTTQAFTRYHEPALGRGESITQRLEWVGLLLCEICGGDGSGKTGAGVRTAPVSSLHGDRTYTDRGQEHRKRSEPSHNYRSRNSQRRYDTAVGEQQPRPPTPRPQQYEEPSTLHRLRTIEVSLWGSNRRCTHDWPWTAFVINAIHRVRTAVQALSVNTDPTTQPAL